MCLLNIFAVIGVFLHFKSLLGTEDIIEYVTNGGELKKLQCDEINDIITRRDYTYSHIIFEGEDLGSLDEIRRMRRSIDYMHHQILFRHC